MGIGSASFGGVGVGLAIIIGTGIGVAVIKGLGAIFSQSVARVLGNPCNHDFTCCRQDHVVLVRGISSITILEELLKMLFRGVNAFGVVVQALRGLPLSGLTNQRGTGTNDDVKLASIEELASVKQISLYLS